MSTFRLICAVVVLVFAPLTGAFAGAHHHCHDVWHGHAQDAVGADEECDSRAPDLELANCDECQMSFAAMPIAAPVLDQAASDAPAAEEISAALAHHVFSLFRPPKA